MPRGKNANLCLTRLRSHKTSGAMSRQSDYQKRHAEEGLCRKCPRKAKKWGLCRAHLKKAQTYYETRRRKLGLVGRYKPAPVGFKVV